MNSPKHGNRHIGHMLEYRYFTF